MTEYRLGQPVTFDRRDILHRRYLDDAYTYGQTVKGWRMGWSSKAPQPAEGIVVGVRTYSDGTVTWGYEGEQTTYRPTCYFRVVLVAFDIHHNPVALLVGDVTPSDEAGNA